MNRPYAPKASQSTNFVQPTTLNLQTRGFAPQKTEDVDEDVTHQSRPASTENVLARLIASPTTDSSTASIQRKSQNRLKAAQVPQISSPMQENSIQREEFPEEEELQRKPMIESFGNISGGQVMQRKLTMKGKGAARRTDGPAHQLTSEVEATLTKNDPTEKMTDKTDLSVSITNRNDENGKILAREGKTEKWESHKWRIEKEKELRTSLS
ncbi:hypothetical protein [Pseudanabaena mucicola]|uniref:Uncharacterized protein n=1 Tax=Pseudanabaena mucicola FACHB-723 TaxID=2692860 RepID=A0ABR8A037_9CYAN|nr:hypothetical protein [Pseudanabaena mucicola]MBD2189419.1 hypothetical protein [Pseudanabaena mucicola FACHB-723]